MASSGVTTLWRAFLSALAVSEDVLQRAAVDGHQQLRSEVVTPECPQEVESLPC